jgi:hypothetical protein
MHVFIAVFPALAKMYGHRLDIQVRYTQATRTQFATGKYHAMQCDIAILWFYLLPDPIGKTVMS